MPSPPFSPIFTNFPKSPKDFIKPSDRNSQILKKQMRPMGKAKHFLHKKRVVHSTDSSSWREKVDYCGGGVGLMIIDMTKLDCYAIWRIVRVLMHKKSRNLHFWVDIFRYFFRLEVSFGDCFQEGAQKFEAGKTYFRSILYPYLREGYRKGEN